MAGGPSQYYWAVLIEDSQELIVLGVSKAHDWLFEDHGLRHKFHRILKGQVKDLDEPGPLTIAMAESDCKVVSLDAASLFRYMRFRSP